MGSVGLYQWGIELHGGVLGFIMESVRLHGGECCITWGVLYYMEGSVELPGVFLLGSGCLILAEGSEIFGQ